MFRKAVLKLTVFLLKRSDLSLKDRALLTSTVLEKLDALPLSDIIVSNEQGTLLVKGKPVTVELARILRESARSALKSPALRIIREQAIYAAFTYGANTATSLEQMIFSKAAIWFGQKEDEYIKLLAQHQASEDQDVD